MPNWCSNELQVYGPIERLREFAEFAKGNEEALSFDCFLPYPEHYAHLDNLRQEWIRALAEPETLQRWPDRASAMAGLLAEGRFDEPCPVHDGYNTGGYEWCITNWGTKWDASSVFHYFDPIAGCHVYTFLTAWGPPDLAIKAMSERFADLEFRFFYKEEGEGFEGHQTYAGGTLIDSYEGDIQSDVEDDPEGNKEVPNPDELD